MPCTGRCLCGAVEIELSQTPKSTGACHCSMCRKWSGGVFLGLNVKAGDAKIKGEDNITAFTSSEWAERCFCKISGTNLFYRVTMDGPIKGEMHIGLGMLDKPDGISVVRDTEIPAEISPMELVRICAGIFLVSVLSGFIPALNAAFQDPVKALRQG